MLWIRCGSQQSPGWSHGQGGASTGQQEGTPLQLPIPSSAQHRWFSWFACLTAFMGCTRNVPAEESQCSNTMNQCARLICSLPRKKKLKCRTAISASLWFGLHPATAAPGLIEFGGLFKRPAWTFVFSNDVQTVPVSSQSHPCVQHWALCCYAMQPVQAARRSGHTPTWLSQGQGGLVLLSCSCL